MQTTLPTQASAAVSRLSTGNRGLDEIMEGGFVPGRLYLLEGAPGTGKTTIAMQFLMANAVAGTKSLYVTLSETAEEMRASAQSHGWQLPEGLNLFELAPPENVLSEDHHQSLLYSSDLELGESVKRIFEEIERVRPEILVLDSLSEIRLLAQSSLRYRRQVLSLKHYFNQCGITALILDDMTTDVADKTVHSVAHGVVMLEELAPTYGAERRRMRVLKYRGSSYRGGYHDLTITRGGVTVFPRLRAAEHRSRIDRTSLGSGIAELDQLLGGGIERGTSALLLGPAGAGKSLLAVTFALESIKRGERVAMFVFDEELGLLFDRAKNMGIELEQMRDDGFLIVEQVDAAELSPGEFSDRVRNTVIKHGVKTVVVDSLNGYQASMPEEQFLLLHIHELLQYLNRQGATTFLTVAQHGLVGDMKAPVDVTYLADTVLLLRFFEARGRVRRAISVIKKRAGHHENTIREYQIGAAGVRLGEPLVSFQGVLRGVPEYAGDGKALIDTKESHDKSGAP
jgi:circadian clock protein KaiC